MIKQVGCRAYFTTLPTNTKVADKYMFFKNGKLINRMPYLIETINGNEYHALRIGCYFSDFLNDDLFRIQLKRKKVYVFTKEDGTIRYE
jgi:hypothetical protein